MQTLFAKSLNRTAISCTCFVRGIGYYVDVPLSRQHHTGYIVLRLPWKEFDIISGETRWSASGVAITELVSDKGLRFYVQSPAGDVWAALHDLPQVSPEIEAVQAIAV